MEERRSGRRLQSGSPVSDIFLLKEKTLATTKGGKPYLILLLGDRDGDYEGKLWDEAELIDEQIERMKPVHVEGVASTYRDKLQITVRTIRSLPWEDRYFERLLPVSSFSLQELIEDLDEMLQTIRNPHLRELAAIIRGDRELMTKFQAVPAAKKFHHAYIRGLLEHTVSMMKIVAFLADHYEQHFQGRLDRDVLLMGTFLHDIGKTREYNYQAGIDFTQEGRLVGHLVLGIEILNTAVSRIPGFPKDLIERLKHLIISHHGELEKGAPVLPMTFEAVLLHLVDYLDSQANAVGRLLAGSTDKQWTEYSQKFERRFLVETLPRFAQEEGRLHLPSDVGEDDFEVEPRNKSRDPHLRTGIMASQLNSDTVETELAPLEGNPLMASARQQAAEILSPDCREEASTILPIEGTIVLEARAVEKEHGQESHAIGPERPKESPEASGFGDSPLSQEESRNLHRVPVPEEPTPKGKGPRRKSSNRSKGPGIPGLL